MTEFIRHQAFDVFRPNHNTPMSKTLGVRLIDTVFYNEHPKVTVEEVRRSLIEHDGYPADITVRKAK